MKAMGIDFGLKRIGVALSDGTRFLASPYETYHRQNEQSDLDHLANIINKEKVDTVVCGLPMNMQGEEQEIARLTREFMQKLSKIVSVNFVFEDERLSSIMAEEMLRETERDWKKRKEKLDMVAASIILQDYLDKERK